MNYSFKDLKSSLLWDSTNSIYGSISGLGPGTVLLLPKRNRQAMFWHQMLTPTHHYTPYPQAIAAGQSVAIDKLKIVDFCAKNDWFIMILIH